MADTETLTLKHEGAYEPTEAQLKRVPKDRVISSTTVVGSHTTYELHPKASPSPSKS